jgi:signal transduction histidine kinase
MAERLPNWMGSIRFRLTAVYSLVLFGLAALMVLGLYTVLARRLNQERVYVSYTVQPVPGGAVISRNEALDQYRVIEHLANQRSLNLLRTYSLSAVGILFLASLVVGWFVAGWVLRPIGRITSVAREIEATDLSQRIALRGPPDELQVLADTFDAMLARLDDAFESRQRFVQETSHELRNPLAVIRTNLEVALADPNPDPAELRRVAEVVQGTVSRMSRLVDDLVVYGRQGAPAHVKEPVDLAELAREAASEFEAVASTRGLRVTVDATPGLTVTGDRIALRQAVTNLLANAVRLAPDGSTVRLAAGADDGGSYLSVTDEGPGIAAEDREHVFERFWRGTDGDRRADGRSGLGLAIVDQIVGAHGGTVAVEPAGAGSRFTLRLPA